MTQTVIALFNNATEAKRAVDTLVDQGFQRSDVDISRGNTDNNYYNDDSNRDTNESGISRFFSSLFGDNDDADKYTRVAERNSSVVTVHAGSIEEARRAADVLDASGAMDVNEKAAEYGYSKTGGDVNKTSMDKRSGNETTSVDRKATEEDLNTLKDQEIEVVEHAEVPVVSKEAKVVEEIKLNKEVEHRDETVRDTV